MCIANESKENYINKFVRIKLSNIKKEGDCEASRLENSPDWEVSQWAWNQIQNRPTRHYPVFLPDTKGIIS